MPYRAGRRHMAKQELKLKTSESEKITINLGPIDLGQIDLLVQEGFYSNRTDLIRTAIRNQLNAHADVVKQTVARKSLVLACSTTRAPTWRRSRRPASACKSRCWDWPASPATCRSNWRWRRSNRSSYSARCTPAPSSKPPWRGGYTNNAHGRSSLACAAPMKDVHETQPPPVRPDARPAGQRPGGSHRGDTASADRTATSRAGSDGHRAAHARYQPCTVGRRGQPSKVTRRDRCRCQRRRADGRACASGPG